MAQTTIEAPAKQRASYPVSKVKFIVLIALSCIGAITILLFLTQNITIIHHRFSDNSDNYECKSEISTDIHDKYVIIEDGTCSKFIDYKNLPDDARIYNLNDRSDNSVNGVSL